jgi:isoleucyl-tRNA synthetase
VINRYQLLRGRRARFVPGWDTHGLPIELKVLQALPEAERRGLDALGLRKRAREYALDQVDRQREQFKRCAPPFFAFCVVPVFYASG